MCPAFGDSGRMDSAGWMRAAVRAAINAPTAEKRIATPIDRDKMSGYMRALSNGNW